jgi:hypothetical protein
MLGFSGLSQTPISSLQGVVASTYTLSVTSTSYSKVDNNTLFRFNKAVKVNIATYATTYNDLSYNYYQGKILSISGNTYSVSSSLKTLQQKRLVLDTTNYSSTLNDIGYKYIHRFSIGVCNFSVSSEVVLEFGRVKVIDLVNYTQSNKAINLLSNKRLILDTTHFSQTNSTAVLTYIHGYAIHPSITTYSLSSGVDVRFDKRLSDYKTDYSLTTFNTNLLQNKRLILDTSSYTLGFNSGILYNRPIPLDNTPYQVNSSIKLLQNKVLELSTCNSTLTTYDVNLIDNYVLSLDPQVYDVINSNLVFIESEKLLLASTIYSVSGELSFSYLRGRILELAKEEYSVDSNISLQYKQRLATSVTPYSTSINLQLQWTRSPLSVSTRSYSSSFKSVGLVFFDIIISPVDLDDITILVVNGKPTVYSSITDIESINLEDQITIAHLDSYITPYLSINTINNIISPDIIIPVENINTINQLIKE